MSVLSAFVESLFFSTDSRSYWQPGHYGLKGAGFKTTNASGHQIDGMVLQPREGTEPLGTVLFFHAAQFNRQFNLPQVVFLALAGYRVVLFDYSGCGLSTGKTTLDGLGEDAEAVLQWMDASEAPAARVVLFGEGVGCDAALQFYEAHPDRVRGLLLESPYASRRGWAKDRWGPVLGDLAARLLRYGATEPAAVLSQVKVPVVLIYPARDTFVHRAQRQAMLSAAPRQTTVWEVPKARFLGIFAGPQGEWHQAVLKWLKKLSSKNG